MRYLKTLIQSKNCLRWVCHCHTSSLLIWQSYQTLKNKKNSILPKNMNFIICLHAIIQLTQIKIEHSVFIGVFIMIIASLTKVVSNNSLIINKSINYTGDPNKKTEYRTCQPQLKSIRSHHLTVCFHFHYLQILPHVSLSSS